MIKVPKLTPEQVKGIEAGIEVDNRIEADHARQDLYKEFVNVCKGDK